MLRQNGFDDIIVAYPSVQASDMDLLVKAAADGGKIIAMADSLKHLEAMDAAGHAAGVELSACLDIDMSYRPLGLGAAHIGVRRSPHPRRGRCGRDGPPGGRAGARQGRSRDGL